MSIVVETADAAEAIRWLRRDVLANTGPLMSLEKNVPRVPRDVWIARDGSETIGVMLVERFPTWTTAQIRTDRADVLPAFVATLDPAIGYTFIVDAASRDEVRALVRDPTDGYETPFLALAPGEAVGAPGDGVAREIRRLAAADRELADAFPAPGERRGPSLGERIETAAEHPEHPIFFGAIVGSTLVSWLEFWTCVDTIREVAMIMTRPDERNRGHAKALLAHATAEMVTTGHTCLYVPAIEESRRVAIAVGYREVVRWYTCEAHPGAVTVAARR